MKYQTNQVQLKETIQQVPCNNESEASEHETFSQLEQNKHDLLDDTGSVVDITQYESLSQVMPNQFQVDMEEPGKWCSWIR